MKQVLVNVPFRDKYTGEMYAAGKAYPMTEDRVKEVKDVNPNFITVIGNAAVEEAPVEEVQEAAEEETVEEAPVKKPKKAKK